MSDRDLNVLAEEMWAITKDLFKFLQFRDRDAMTACGLSVAQCYTLDAIGSQGRATLNEVAEALYITPSTASRAVDDLVRKGLVERGQDAADRRAVCLSLTPQGQALFEALRHHLVQRQLTILQQIDPDSRRDVLAALQKLAQAIKDPACCAVPFAGDMPQPPASLACSKATSGKSRRVATSTRKPIPTLPS
ncbi:MAG TPA: MarR family winged helix-turn-helix transcriptional regulator [Alphaproteobacteria bacterium]|nr:MarR family winged helix-turn-helix transcriptional regulator [Alphaproteobacteria bacterium]